MYIHYTTYLWCKQTFSEGDIISMTCMYSYVQFVCLRSLNASLLVLLRYGDNLGRSKTNQHKGAGFFFSGVLVALTCVAVSIQQQWRPFVVEWHLQYWCWVWSTCSVTCWHKVSSSFELPCRWGNWLIDDTHNDQRKNFSGTGLYWSENDLNDWVILYWICLIKVHYWTSSYWSSLSQSCICQIP